MLWSPLAVTALALLAAARAAHARGTALTITVFDVGQADSQLLVFPSGYTVLIDLGELGPLYNYNAVYVAQRIRDITGGSHVDVAVATHLHLDHIGQANKGGFWSLFEKQGITVDKFIDRDSGKWIDANADGKCDTPGEIQWKYIGSGPPTSSTSMVWLCYATKSTSTVGKVREIARLCDTTQIAPPDSGAAIRVVAADAFNTSFQNATSSAKVADNYFGAAMPPYENDYSIGLLINYGGFTYGTFGDLDGKYGPSSSGYYYNDEETTTIPRVGPVDLYHVNHHGSSYSSNAAFLKVLSPTVSVVSCGANNSYSHPSTAAMNRLAAVNSQVYMTNRGVFTADYGTAVIADGDITISVVPNSGKFSVTAAGKTREYATKGATSLPPCGGSDVPQPQPQPQPQPSAASSDKAPIAASSSPAPSPTPATASSTEPGPASPSGSTPAQPDQRNSAASAGLGLLALLALLLA